MAKRTHKGVGSRPPSRRKSLRGHGGARDGAGRRAVLNDEQRLWIGVYYQNCWDELTRKRARRRQRSDATKTAIRKVGVAGKEALSQLRSAHRDLRKLPVQHRSGKWVSYPRERAKDWIENALGGRHVSYAPYIKRPKGLRPALMRYVALKASKEFGVKVSQRMVESSMKQYRKNKLEFCPD